MACCMLGKLSIIRTISSAQKCCQYLKGICNFFTRCVYSKLIFFLCGKYYKNLFLSCCTHLCIPVPPEKVERIMDQIEKYIMTRLYKFVFCPETTDDEKKDLAIQKRIRWLACLSFICFLEWNDSMWAIVRVSVQPWAVQRVGFSARLMVPAFLSNSVDCRWDPCWIVEIVLDL